MMSLHSYQGLKFDNQLCEDLCRMFKIYKTRTTAYAPWGNGMVECSNKTIKAILRALDVRDKDNWDELLPDVTVICVARKGGRRSHDVSHVHDLSAQQDWSRRGKAATAARICGIPARTSGH
jgi:hypothetical protein